MDREDSPETSEIVGKPIKSIKFPKDVIIGAVVKGEVALVPEGETVINPGDRVVLFSPSRSISKIEKLLKVK